MTGDMCSDDRFELIEKAKGTLMERTNIEMRPDEMMVLDSILFRCWQMGWLDQLRENRYSELFGTPERAARTFADFCDVCDKGECNDCPMDKLTDYCIGFDDLLEWLRGDA